MKIRDLSFLAVRVLSIYLFILGFKHIINLLEFTIHTYLWVLDTNTSYLEVFLIIGIPSLVLFITSIILWLYANQISLHLIPQSSRESVQSIQVKDIEGFILAIIGLILMILSFTTLVRIILNYYHITSQDIHFNSRDHIFVIIEHSIRFIIGIVLLLKAEGFAMILRNIRSMGLKHI